MKSRTYKKYIAYYGLRFHTKRCFAAAVIRFAARAKHASMFFTHLLLSIS